MRFSLAAGCLLSLLLLSGPGGLAVSEAASTGTIEGVVTNETTGRPQAGVEVALTSGTRGENRSETRTETTDRQGRYRFARLPTGEERFYAVDARFQDGLFSGGAITIPDDTDEQPVIESTLKVWETTTDPAGIVIARDSAFLEPREATLSVLHSVTVANTDTRAYIGRGGSDDTDEGHTSIGFGLPGRADPASLTIVDADLNVPELVPTDFGFGATIAVPPGEHRFTFSYTVGGTAAAYDISRRALYPTLRMSLFATEELDLQSNRLRDEGEVEIGERTYREYAAEDQLDAGDSMQAVVIADAGIPRSLILGMAGALALILALGLLPLLKRRRGSDEEETPDEIDERDVLLGEIAELDLKRDRGEVDEAVWAQRRRELKDRLLGEKEDAP